MPTGRREPMTAGSSHRLIEALLERRSGPHRYLEIGVAQGHTFCSVSADRLVAVDPFPDAFEVPSTGTLHRMTSREYFDTDLPAREGPFSVVFVDGMHLWAEAAADVVGAFRHLRPDGFVIVDDVFPSGHWEGLPASGYEEAVRLAAAEGYQLRLWMGDVWRVVRLIADARILGLHWMTTRVSGSRFHTVYWYDGQGDVATALASAVERERSGGERRSVPRRRRLGGGGLPRWYREAGFDELVERAGRTAPTQSAQ